MALHLAVLSGNIAEAKNLLTDPAVRSAINSPVDGTVVLMSAAMRGDTEMVELLLLAGADDRIAASEGCLPLHAAAVRGHTDVANSLLLLGHADCIDVQDHTGATPMALAAAGGYIEIVSVLLTIGADCSIADKEGCTPAHVAAAKGHIDIVHLFFRKFSVEEVLAYHNKSGENALLAALHGGYLSVEVMILYLRDIDGNDSYHVHLAAMTGHLSLVTELMKQVAVKGVLNRKSPEGLTLLLIACKGGHLDMVRYFLSLGADVTIADADGQLPIHWAAKCGNVDIIKALLENPRSKATLSTNDYRGRTPALVAAYKGRAEALDYLLSMGGYPMVPDSDGYTPLQIVAANGELACLNVLLISAGRSKAVARAMEVEYFSALQLAITNGHGDVVLHMRSSGNPKKDTDLLRNVAVIGNLEVMKSLLQLPALRSLIDGGSDGTAASPPLLKAILNDHPTLAIFLIAQGANMTLRVSNGQLALHSAAAFGMMDVVKELLKDDDLRKATINVQDDDGSTPLLVASHNGHVAMVEYLLSLGADPFLAAQRIQLPIHWAASKGFVGVVAALLKYDRDGRMLNARTKRGSTPLHDATSRHQLEMMEFLLQNGANDRIVDEEGLIPLHTAALNNELEPAKILIKYDPKRETVNVRSTVDGTTPLFIAGVQGYIDFVRYLLSLGADVRIPNHRGQLTAHVAAVNGFVDVVQLLFRQGPPTGSLPDPRVKGPRGMTVMTSNSNVVQFVNFSNSTVTTIDPMDSPKNLDKKLKKMEKKQHQQQQEESPKSATAIASAPAAADAAGDASLPRSVDVAASVPLVPSPSRASQVR